MQAPFTYPSRCEGFLDIQETSKIHMPASNEVQVTHIFTCCRQRSMNIGGREWSGMPPMPSIPDGVELPLSGLSYGGVQGSTGGQTQTDSPDVDHLEELGKSIVPCQERSIPNHSRIILLPQQQHQQHQHQQQDEEDTAIW